MLKDKLEDDVLDLSLMQLEEVPVKDIALIKKGTTVDLSNNLLVLLPDTFPATLTHIVRLDLSKNKLRELPEFFGLLKNLKHLDLYSNQISRLPVSFSQLKNLKWLDLKCNPLVPALAEAAGPCVDATDCAKCAKNVVGLMTEMQVQLEQERDRLYRSIQLKEQIKQEVQESSQVSERSKRGKKPAKKPVSTKTETSPTPRMKRSKPEPSRTVPESSGPMPEPCRKGQSSFALILMMVAAVAFGALISMLWIYTGGRLDQKSIDRAVPVIMEDVNKLMAELDRRANKAAHIIVTNVGPYFCYVKQAVFDLVVAVNPYWQSLKKTAVKTFNMYYPIVSNFLKTKFEEFSAFVKEYIN